MPNTDLLRGMISSMVEPYLVESVQKFHENHREEILYAKGSGHKHQYWKGGYHDHICQCLFLAGSHYDLMSHYGVTGLNRKSSEFPFVPPFRLQSAALVLYFHDIEKIFKYGGNERSYEPELLVDNNIWHYGILPEKYGIYFSKDEFNALKYIHGEGAAHDEIIRAQTPLAAFCHCIDVMSARIFFDYTELSWLD